MAVTLIPQTGLQAFTPLNATLSTTTEYQYRPVIPSNIRPYGVARPMQLVNTGAHPMVVQRGVTTDAGTLGVTIQAAGTLDLEGPADIFIYSTLGTSIAFVEK